MRRRGLVTPARSLVLGGDTGASLPAAGTETSGTRRERGAQRQAEPGGHAAARARARVRGVPSHERSIQTRRVAFPKNRMKLPTVKIANLEEELDNENRLGATSPPVP